MYVCMYIYISVHVYVSFECAILEDLITFIKKYVNYRTFSDNKNFLF